MKSRLKTTWILVVIITALLSCLAIGLTSAKYHSEFTGAGSAQAAKWEVKGKFVFPTSSEDKLSLSDRSQGYVIKVESNSDVDVEYDIVITFSHILFKGVVIELIDTDTGDVKTLTSNGSQKTFTFSNVGILTSTKSTANYEIFFFVASDASTDDGIMVKDYTVDISVKTEQAKPTGAN